MPIARTHAAIPTADRVHRFQYAIRSIVGEAQKVEASGKQVHYLNIGDPVAFGFDTTYNHDRKFTREYSVGGDLNLGHVYLRLAEFSWKRTEGFLFPATQTVSAGLGVRF